MRALRKLEASVKHATKMRETTPMTRCSTLVFPLRPIMFLGACAKKAAPPPPPPPPSLTAPTASLSANPNTVDPGQPTTPTWQTTNPTDVTIDGNGPVDPHASRQATPTDSTTDHPSAHA